MGDSLERYYNKVVPLVLTHRSYKNSFDGDTTERIFTIFKDTLKTDVFMYRIDPDIDSLVVSQHIRFKYTGGIIQSALLLALADDKLEPNKLDEYSYTDSSMSIQLSLRIAMSKGLKKTYKDIYYNPDDNKSIRHRHYNFLDLGNGKSYWYESYGEMSFFDEDSCNRKVKFSTSKIDSTWTIKTYSSKRDTVTTTVTNKKDILPIVTLEKIVSVYNKDRIQSVLSNIYNNKGDSLVRSISENFYYGKDSLRYERGDLNISSGSYSTTYAENHYYDSLKRTTKIVYFSRDNMGLEWNMVGEDFLVYENFSYISNSIFSKKNNFSITIKQHTNKLNFFIKTSQKLCANGELYTISGRKIAMAVSIKSKTGYKYTFSTMNLAIGHYFFRINDDKISAITPVLIGINQFK